MPDVAAERPIRLVHLISGLGVGGAEMMLYGLSASLSGEGFQVRVVSMTDDGPLAARIQSLGVPVTALGMRRGVPDARGALHFRRLLREDPPDILQTWMYHADLLGAIAGRGRGGPGLVWGIHNTALEARHTKALTRLVVRINAWISGRAPTAIVCCSEEARRAHVRLGFDAERMVIIPNGVDLSRFRPDPGARASVRQELDVGADGVLIGMAARYHPQKDHRTFVEAARKIKARNSAAHFLLCGNRVTPGNGELQGMVEAAGLADRIHLLGVREDMPRVMAALDLAVLSSAYAEAFPLVIAEAMACEVPCAVTDVGDSAAIVGETGAVVPPRNPEALAGACLRLLEGGERRRRELGRAARKRIEERYSLARAVGQYAALYRRLSGRG